MDQLQAEDQPLEQGIQSLAPSVATFSQNVNVMAIQMGAKYGGDNSTKTAADGKKSTNAKNPGRHCNGNVFLAIFYMESHD